MIKKSIISVLFVALIVMQGYAQEVNRIISLAPSVTKNIYLLNAQSKLVGCTSYCIEGTEDGKEIVGSAVNVNLEKVILLQPDLVLTMTLTKPQDVEAMKRLGIKVIVIQTPKTFEEICEQTLMIGKLIGSEETAFKVVQETKQTVDELKQRCLQITSKSKIFFQIGANPIFTVLENTFMDDYILFCNGENIANGMTKGTMTRESVLVRNPDVIIIATMGGFGKEEQETWLGYNGISAAKNRKVFLIDSETACSPTPKNFAKALTDVYKFINQ